MAGKETEEPPIRLSVISGRICSLSVAYWVAFRKKLTSALIKGLRSALQRCLGLNRLGSEAKTPIEFAVVEVAVEAVEKSKDGEDDDEAEERSSILSDETDGVVVAVVGGGGGGATWSTCMAVTSSLDALFSDA